MTLQRFVLPALAFLTLGACSTTGQQAEWSELQSNPREFFNLNSPVRLAGDAVAGTTVTLKQGQALVVRLPEDPASGYVWRMRPLPRGPVTAAVQRDLTAKSAGSNAAASAGSAEATFRLRGVAPGTETVTLDYIRPGFSAPEKSLAFDVAVR